MQCNAWEETDETIGTTLLETHMPLGYVNKTDMQMFTHSVLLLCTEIITLQPPATHYTNDHY